MISEQNERTLGDYRLSRSFLFLYMVMFGGASTCPPRTAPALCDDACITISGDIASHKVPRVY